MKRKFGSRHNSCPNSPTYQKYSVSSGEKAGRAVWRIGKVRDWHGTSAMSMAESATVKTAKRQFRVWLKEKYGTIEEVE